jgi:Rrf2 family nitric oxide-sensitive transcriptional repressor
VRLTRFSDYAVRVMLYLAAHTDRLCSIGEIAKAYDISQNHLMKVVGDLAGRAISSAARARGRHPAFPPGTRHQHWPPDPPHRRRNRSGGV